jgi:hypothetical protein
MAGLLDSRSAEDTEDTMHLFHWIASRRMERKESASFFCLALLYMFAHVALAEQPAVQTAPTAFDASALGKPAQDVTMAGTLQQIISTRGPGVPAGIQLVADGPQGAFTAILGSVPSGQLRQALVPGAPVQVSGVKETVNGQSYLLGRKLTIAGNQIIIRNEHGFLVHPQQRSRASVNNSVLSPGAK